MTTVDTTAPSRSAGARVLALWRWLGRAFAAERERWPLWLPVALGVGIGMYFALPFEPSAWIGPAATVGAIAVAALLLRRDGVGARLGALVLIALATAGAGFAVAQLRTAMVAAPVLAKPWGPGAVQGRVRAVEALPSGKRIVLDQVALSRLPATDTPARIRVRLAGKTAPADLAPGQELRLRAALMPPPGPVAPGAFDFQRRAWFDRLGAVGYAVARPEIVRAAEPSGASLWLADLRQRIAERVRAALPGDSGAVAAALLTGDRGAIPKSAIADMRDSGLAHLLAISGLHVGLVAGFIFLVVRGGLALLPPVALRYPIKKWAAVAALAGAFAYLMIAGATVPTQRAYLMIGLVFLAVLLDRSAMSMRLVAWAAIAILLLAPESLVTASFQLSFAAVVALVAGYEALRGRLSRWRRHNGQRLWRRPVLYVAGIALTTLIAGAATGIFAIHHFNRMALYGLAANMAAVPITALWIMPWGLASMLLMPFGLEGLALLPMGWGIDLVLAVANSVSGWPGAVALVPAMPTVGLIAIALGGLWLCLWQRPWRLAGLAGLLVGLISIGWTPPPDILVTGDGKLIAARAASGSYMLSSGRSGRFAADGWLRRAGERDRVPWPREGISADGRLRCDAVGCLYRVTGHRVALVRNERALAEDCWRADHVISLEPVRIACPVPGHVIDRFDLWRNGGHAVWLGADGVRVESVNQTRGARPWVPRRPFPSPTAGKD